VRNLFIPLWYPPEESYAGGFYRAKRIVESLQKYKPYVVASDTFPLHTTHLLRYPTRTIRAISPQWFKLVRALNWAWSTLAIVMLGLAWG